MVYFVGELFVIWISLFCLDNFVMMLLNVLYLFLDFIFFFNFCKFVMIFLLNLNCILLFGFFNEDVIFFLNFFFKLIFLFFWLFKSFFLNEFSEEFK